MKNELTEEQAKRIESIGSAKELQDFAKENNVELTDEQASSYYAQLVDKKQNLTAEDLNDVSGGGVIKLIKSFVKSLFEDTKTSDDGSSN